METQEAEHKRLRLCEERGRLLSLLNRATNRYAEAAADLTRVMSITVQREYLIFLRDAEEALKACQEARQTLTEHRKQHGC